jgi:hypothetical protein
LTFESRRTVKVSPRIAVSFPAKQSAVGRLLLAQLSDSIVSEILAGNTPHDAAIRSQMGELRSSGAIVDRGAIEAEVVSLSRVVRGFGNEAAGAIEVLVPQYRAKLEAVLPSLEEAASQISAALGSLKVGALAGSSVSSGTVAPGIGAPGAGRLDAAVEKDISGATSVASSTMPGLGSVVSSEAMQRAKVSGS